MFPLSHQRLDGFFFDNVEDTLKLYRLESLLLVSFLVVIFKNIWSKISELTTSLKLRLNAYIRPYMYTLSHWQYVRPNAYIRPYVYTLPHISHVYYLTRTYGIPIPHVLTDFWSSVWPDPIHIQCRTSFLIQNLKIIRPIKLIRPSVPGAYL